MAHRLEIMAKDISNAKLFDELVRDLRCVSLKMPEQRISVEQRKEKYQRAVSVIRNNPRPLKGISIGVPVNLGEYGLINKIANQDTYEDCPELEPLRDIFRAYNQHYLDRFHQAR